MQTENIATTAERSGVVEQGSVGQAGLWTVGSVPSVPAFGHGCSGAVCWASDALAGVPETPGGPVTHFGTVPGTPALPSARHRNSIPARSELGTEPSHEAASATDSSSNLGAELGFTGRAGFSGVLGLCSSVGFTGI